MNVPEIFASNVFNDKAMKTALPRDTYKALKNTIKNGIALTPDMAKVVANAMKTWAIDKGATHYTHWFQPMTGLTAEKHDSFVTPSDEGIIMSFGGDVLIRSEPDASSFPSGGIRATFEARGYTAWDPTSYAFIKDGVLCIPSVFYSYTGEALDKKTPLLRSMDVLNREALRIVKLFGDTESTRVITTVGVEQEFFLVDKTVFDQRPDLALCGRTVFGANPPKGQELDDHYFGTIKPRVHDYLKELSVELWKLGIYAKTHHNEVAPAQHEVACVFSDSNTSADQNQLVMETLKNLAKKHGMECLIHEKPFANLNGSGKHNNWSMATNMGENLLEPGKEPHKNYKFLLFVAAVLKAIDRYGPLLRASVASAANDHRLGGNEAPPSIISVYLGSEIKDILDALADGKPYTAPAKEAPDLGVTSLTNVLKDTTDRNRTSPFAFTGNKFEFRMPGSSTSISEPNFILNTIAAEALSEFADILEPKVAAGVNIDDAVKELVAETMKAHRRIIFNGDGYSQEWQDEASKRGLENLRTTVDALPVFVRPETIAMFEKHGVLTKGEIAPRCDIMLEEYAKRIHIEAATMIRMADRFVIPSIFEYENELVKLSLGKKELSLPYKLEEATLKSISELTEKLQKAISTLKPATEKVHDYEEPIEAAKYCQSTVIPAMMELRIVVDQLEEVVVNWPFPSYMKMLASV